MTAISFARHQEEQLNHEARRTRVTSQLAILKPSAPPTIDRVLTPKRLTREELREQYAKGLCWHCDEPWSREHCYSKGRLLIIEPIEEEVIEHPEESLEHEEEDVEEEPQLNEVTVYALASYSNPQTMKVGGLLKQQPITVLIDTGNTNNFLNSKVTIQMALPIENCSRFDVKVANGWILKYDRRRLQVKLLLIMRPYQEIIAHFFLLPLDDHEAMLIIKWLMTLGDIS